MKGGKDAKVGRVMFECGDVWGYGWCKDDAYTSMTRNKRVGGRRAIELSKGAKCLTGNVIIYGGFFECESRVDDGEDVDVMLLDIGTESVKFVYVSHAVNVDCRYSE